MGRWLPVAESDGVCGGIEWRWSRGEDQSQLNFVKRTGQRRNLPSDETLLKALQPLKVRCVAAAMQNDPCVQSDEIVRLSSTASRLSYCTWNEQSFAGHREIHSKRSSFWGIECLVPYDHLDFSSLLVSFTKEKLKTLTCLQKLRPLMLKKLKTTSSICK